MSTPGESIGTARLDIVVDTSQFDIAVERAKSRTSSMSQSAQAEYAKLNVAERRRVETLIKQADTIDLTRAQQIAYNAALKVQGPLLEDITRRLSTQQAVATGAAQTIGRVGKSQRELSFAMRGVPAQFTDIATSIAGGQSFWLVALQQGGQLRDMFGGIRPAASALASTFVSMITPMTLLASGIATVVAAWHAGESEGARFNKALALTGNVSGATADSMRDMAASIGDGQTTTMKAAAALATVAESGKFTASQFRMVAESAIYMERANGQAANETVKQFAKLAEDPVTAVAKLNDELHFLTAAQFENIKSLYEQGDAQAAAQAAMESYASAVKLRTQDVLASLGTLEKGWYYLKVGAVSAWDAMLGVGRDLSGAQKFQETFRQLQEVENPSNIFSFAQLGPKGSAARQKRAAELRAELQRLQDENIQAQRDAGKTAAAQQANDFAIQLDRELDQYASKEQKRTREIERTRKAANDAISKALAVGDKQLAEQIAADQKKLEAGIEAKYTDKSKRRKASTTDPTVSIISRLKEQIAVNQEQEKSEDRLTTSERLHIQVQQDLERIGSKVTSGRRTEIEALLKQVDATGKAAEAAKKDAEAKKDMARLTAQLAAAEENRRRSNEADLAEIGRGGNAVEQLRRKLDIEREFENGLKEIRRNSAGKAKEALQAEEDALRASRERSLDIERDYQQRRLEMMGDWKNGARAAYEDYLAETSDVASQSRKLFSNAFSSLEDAAVQFATTGKASVRDLLSTMGEEIARFFIKKSVVKFLEFLANAWGNGYSDSQSFGSLSGMGDFGLPIQNAKGGVYSGSPSLSAYSGKVVDKPTMFAFARGAGIMGEAGPEAIMPLARGSDGKLGVRSQGGSTVQLIVQTYVTADGQSRTETSGERDSAFGQVSAQIGTMVKQEIVTMMRPNGLLWRAGVRANG